VPVFGCDALGTDAKRLAARPAARACRRSHTGRLEHPMKWPWMANSAAPHGADPECVYHSRRRSQTGTTGIGRKHFANVVSPANLLRVMKYDPHRMTTSRNDAADAVAQIHPVDAARALHGTIVDSEHDSIPLTQRHNDRP
jgi:hypothetical protein